MSDLDILLAKDPLELSAQDIDKIIELQRRARANFEAGIKPKKETGPTPDLKAVVTKITQKAEPPAIPRRRF